MNENIEKTDVGETGEQVKEPEKKPAERMYTQEEYERGIAKATANTMRKLETARESAKQSQISGKIKDVIVESIGFEGTDEELLEHVANHYGKNGKQVVEDFKKGDINKREMNAKLQVYEFLESPETTDEDIIEAFERIAEKPEYKQTVADKIQLKILQKKYRQIKNEEFARDAERVYLENYGDSEGFEELKKSSEFRAFVNGLNIPLSDAVKKYCSLKGIKKAKEPKKEKLSSGSAKDFGGGTEPEYFTQEQVAKMSREEIEANYDLIKKSQKKWYKKG